MSSVQVISSRCEKGAGKSAGEGEWSTRLKAMCDVMIFPFNFVRYIRSVPRALTFHAAWEFFPATWERV